MRVVFKKEIDPIYQKFVKRLFKSITYKNNFWVTILDLIELNSEKFIIFQLSCSTKCSNVGCRVTIETLEKLLPVNISESDHVMIIYKTVRDFELHEVTENFKYNKQSVYTEHAPINRLYNVAQGIDREVKNYG